nr:MAG TPA: hypothetical protein [Caudoviricetes sp.]
MSSSLIAICVRTNLTNILGCKQASGWSIRSEFIGYNNVSEF